MRHRVKTKKFNKKKGARDMMLRNLAASVLMYEKVKTTEAKAKTVKSLVDKAITVAKKGDLQARRDLLATLPQKLAVKKAFEVLKDRYADKKGGYTRIVKLGARTGDGAKIALIELV